METRRYFSQSSLHEPGQNDRRRKVWAAPASLPPRIPDTVGGMEQRMTALERAFQLARSGRVAGVTDIITLLNREGYYGSQIEGRLLKRQLADLIKAARNVIPDPPGTRSVNK
jgi:LmbE family N-acetylglucosaminyl deacetylase